MTPPDHRLRWGVVGTGAVATAFVEDLRRTDSSEVVAVGSRDLARARQFGADQGVSRHHGSYADLVEDEAVDAVYVATPHPFHHPAAMLGLRAGKAVLVEKPFTMSAPEAVELVATARATGAFLMEAMWSRFLTHMVEIRALLASGALGDLVCVTADHGQWFPDDPSARIHAPELGGGALLDLGVYVVSFASMVLGAPTVVTALRTRGATPVDSQTSILLGHASGAHAVLTCTSAAVSATRACIVGTEARIEIAGEFYGPTSYEVLWRDGRRERFAPDTGVTGLGTRPTRWLGACTRAGRRARTCRGRRASR